MEAVGWRVPFEMQQHQLAGLAQCSLQYPPRPMYFDPPHAGALQLIDGVKEEDPYHAHVQRWHFVRWDPCSFYKFSLTVVSSVTIISILRLKTLIQFANATNATRKHTFAMPIKKRLLTKLQRTTWI
jgi:hypothetical protein